MNYCAHTSNIIKISILSLLITLTWAPSSLCNERPKRKKSWTWLIYGAADNNLRDYISRNIKQAAVAGSNENVNILFHVDTRLMGNKKTTKRYYVEKNNPVQINIVNEKTPMDSGDPQTFISACRWAIQDYPADNYGVIFWDHGTGIIDPYGKRHFDTASLFHFNAAHNAWELDRNVDFIDLIEMQSDPKGVCFDDTTGNYLTNQKLETALQEVTTKYLGGKKFEIIAFDACLMAMLEVAEIIKRYAKIQISSEEVEPGAGYRYDHVFSIFAQGVPTSRNLAQHIVNSFALAYKPAGNHPGFVDYTQSAFDLDHMAELESNIDQLAQLLILALQSDQSSTFRNVIAQSRNKKSCTYFSESTYIDLDHFYSNLIKNIHDTFRTHSLLKQQLITSLEQGKDLIKKVVIHNVSGPNLPLARGISIFFPERKIHPSYKKTNFAATNNWIKFLSSYLLS